MLCSSENALKGMISFVTRLTDAASQSFDGGANPLIFVLFQEIEKHGINVLRWLIRVMRLVHRLRYESCGVLRRVLLQTAIFLEKTHADSQVDQILVLQDMIETDIRRLEH